MKKEIAERWIKALRSGKYRQSKGRLKNRRNGFCCLGVLCDVMKDEVGGKWKRFGSDPAFKVSDSSLYYETTTLPASVLIAAGLKSCDPKVTLDNDFADTCLTIVNDKRRLTFKQIANLIEKQWRDM